MVFDSSWANSTNFVLPFFFISTAHDKKKQKCMRACARRVGVERLMCLFYFAAPLFRRGCAADSCWLKGNSTKKKTRNVFCSVCLCRAHVRGVIYINRDRLSVFFSVCMCVFVMRYDYNDVSGKCIRLRILVQILRASFK